MNELTQKQKAIIDSDGPWSAHNFILNGDNYTITNGIVNDEWKLRRVIQNIADLTNKNFSELRILDLACLEGLFGIECARQGASVVFLDARNINLRKVEFAIEQAGLKNTQVVKDDVRAISVEKYGKFDVILCFGIFYHLDKNDLFPFVEKMYEMCTGFVYFDTHITPKKKEYFVNNSITYFGESYQEHRGDATVDEKDIELWKSLDNQRSFMMTRNSLVKMLKNIGFTSALESHLPYDKTKNFSRISLFAVKGKPVQLISTPLVNNNTNDELPEFSILDFISEKITKYRNDILYTLKLNAPRALKSFYNNHIKK